MFRDKDEPKGPNGESNPNFYLRKQRYVYVRPGAYDYIRRIQAHPRVKFGFYSSMKASNITDIAKILGDQEGIGPFEIFDAVYSSKIDENPQLKPL